MEKVRAKLFNLRSTVEGSTEEDPDEQFIASMPDNLDAIDDILYDRGPLNEKQVRLFGGWLDDNVAGRKAGELRVTIPPRVGEKGQMEEEEEENALGISPESMSLTGDKEDRAVTIFSAAMSAFNKGKYKYAVSLYAEAVDLVGESSRLGGQYQLWHAQALDAMGEKGQAARMLDDLRTHTDGDVRKVSRELLFIITAPALDLDPGTFLDIPSFDQGPKPDKGMPVLTSNFGPLRTALVEKKPERYSLEWYIKKGRPRKVKDNTGFEVVLVAAAIGFTLAYMLSTPPV